MYEENSLWPGWKTVRLIGKGSFGSVYEIERQMFDEVEKAALKVITIPQNQSDINEMYSDGYDSESITDTFKSHLKSIVSEYSMMKRMNGSANIVNCDDVRYIQHADGIGWDIYIKMELLTPLSDALAGGITEKTAVRVGKDLCQALVLCSKYGIIHRDIKPQNIFVSPHGDYKLGDFGIAKTVEKTSGGTKIGTYKYMAPEVYNNKPYGVGADIYSLGLVLYWMLNERRMPFLPLPPAKLKAGLDEEARLRRFNGEKIPAPLHGSSELKRIVLKACAFDLKDRYQTAEEMLSDMEALEEKAAPVPTAVPEAVAAEEKPTEEQEEGTVSVFSAAVNKNAEEKKPEKPEAAVVTEPEKREPVAETKPEPVTEQDSSKIEEIQDTDLSEDEVTLSVFHKADDKKVEKDNTKLESKKEVPVCKPKREEEIRIAPIHKSEPLKQSESVHKDEVPKNNESERNECRKDDADKKKKITLLILAVVLVIGIILASIFLFNSCEKDDDSGFLDLNIDEDYIDNDDEYPNNDVESEAQNQQLEWTDWTDELPENVTEEDFEIEEQILYSSRTLETTSSTEKDTMDGWELYDTVEGKGEFGPWSEWSVTKVEPSDTREVEKQTRYRYRKKETVTGTSSSKDGWTLYNTTYSWGKYGGWSNWSTTAATSSDSRKVESKTQYRYRNITWNNVYTDWSSWSSWQDSYVSENDFRKVQTRTAYHYYYFKCKYCGKQLHGENVCVGWDGGCGRTNVGAGTWTSIRLSTPYSEAMDYGGTGVYYIVHNGQKVFAYIRTNSEHYRPPITQYRYATRSNSLIASYGSWSEWGDTTYTDSMILDAENRTVYRYCDRTKVATYHFYRWGSWSGWSVDKKTATNDMQVEEAVYYRYHDKILEKTYYFRRWTDWTDYSDKEIIATDSTEVQTKTQYRYRSKTD